MSFHLPRIGPALCALSAGILALTDESSAQVMPQRDSRTLSAAMTEASRSPFHARDPVNHSMNARPAPGGDPARLFGEGTQTRGRFNETVEDPRAASDRAAGTALLVWSTALGTVAGDFLASRVFSVDDDPFFRSLIRHGILSVPIAASVTTLGGAHPGWALLGSSLGFPTGVGAGILVAYALEEDLGYAALLPAYLTYYAVRVAVVVATVKLAGT